MVEDKRFEMRVSAELLAAVDAWAHAQPDRPPRATAVKRLIAIGIGAKPAALKTPKKGAARSAIKPKPEAKK